MYQENKVRLKKCFEKAQAGKKMTIGFLGGSITQGSLASEHKKTYAYQVFSWWKEQYPNTEFSYVNAGIGGTTSHFGVSRVKKDLMIYQPDLVILDFCVNDEANEFFQETFEGLLRKILTWKSDPAILVLNNIFFATGANAEEYHNKISEYYGIPHVDIRDSIYRKIQEGIYQPDQITPDGLHPNNHGHTLIAKEISKRLEQLQKELENEKIDVQIENMPKPLTKNAYEHAKCLTIQETQPKLLGFYADPEEKKGHLDVFKNGWIGKHTGDKICFELEASCIAVQYRRTIQRPAAKAKLILDGNEEDAKILDGNFEENWGDCLYLEVILHHGERKIHKIEMEIIEDAEDKTPFYLLSFITN